MSKKEFAEFIGRQVPPEPPPDWAAELREWLKHLADLYTLVDSALADFTAKGQIVVERREIELTEENIGRYKAPSRTIKFGHERTVALDKAPHAEFLQFLVGWHLPKLLASQRPVIADFVQANKDCGMLCTFFSLF
jgi:hypothetical protein